MNYILKNKIAVLEPDLMKWAKAFEEIDRIVAKTNVADSIVSTVFLGIDHNYSSLGEPVLFETMIFGGDHDEYMERCCTWDEAEKQHEKAVNMLKSEIQIH